MKKGYSELGALLRVSPHAPQEREKDLNGSISSSSCNPPIPEAQLFQTVQAP